MEIELSESRNTCILVYADECTDCLIELNDTAANKATANIDAGQSCSKNWTYHLCSFRPKALADEFRYRRKTYAPP
jgi:hypothetical protein